MLLTFTCAHLTHLTLYFPIFKKKEREKKFQTLFTIMLSSFLWKETKEPPQFCDVARNFQLDNFFRRCTCICSYKNIIKEYYKIFNKILFNFFYTWIKIFMTKNIIQYEIIKKTGIKHNILFYKRNNHDILTCNFIVYKYK